MTASRRILFLFLLIAAISNNLFAEVFRFKADRKTGTRAKGRELIVLEGNAKVESETLILTADRIEIQGDDMQRIECRGNVTGIDEERGLYFTTDLLRYDRVNKFTRLSGNSVMEDKRNEVIAKARFIEYNETLGTSLLQVGVRIFKGDLVCRSDYAFWRREEKDLELASFPVVYKGSDVFRAARMRINLDTEELLMEGTVSGTLKTASSEEEEKKKDVKTDGEAAKTPERPEGAAGSDEAPKDAPPPPKSPEASSDSPAPQGAPAAPGGLE